MTSRLSFKRTLARLAALVLAMTCAAAPAQAAKKGATPDGKAAAIESFVPLDSFQAAVVYKQRLRGVLVVDLGVDIPDTRARQHFRSAIPRIRDHMLRSLNSFAGSEVRPDRPLNVARLTGRLQAVANAYANGQETQVLLVNVVFHRR